MNLVAVVFFVCLITTNATLLSEPHFLSIFNEHENSLAIECLLKIMRKHIPCSTVVTFVYSNDDVNYLVEKINNSECYTVIVRSFNDYNWLIRTEAYVILTETLEELAYGMSLITIDSFWNPRARIISHAHDIEHEDIKRIFDVFMKYRTYNVVFVTNNENNAEIFTYFPFENGYCGKHFDNATMISYCDKFSEDDDFFPNKHKDRMNNCTVKVLITEDIPNTIITKNENGIRISGIEPAILNSIAVRENLNIVYEVRKPEEGYGVVLPNHTATGLLALLQHNKADMAAGGFVLMKNRVDVFDYIYGFNFATYDLYVPIDDDPVWTQIDVEFDNTTWILLLVYFCTIIFVFLVFLNVSPRIRHSNSDIILKLWGFFYLGNSTGRLLKVTRLRTLLVCWIWFTFFITNFYTTGLYSLITAQVKTSHIYIDPDDLSSLPLKPCVSYQIRQFFQFAFNQTLPENEPIDNCSFTETALDTVASRTDLYAIEMSYSYEMRADRLIDDNGNPKLDTWHLATDKTLTFLLARGYPLRERFQSYALRMYEVGFIQLHADYLLHKVKRKVTGKPDYFRIVELDDFKIHYLILAVGSLVSTACLIIELIYVRLIRVK